VSPRATSQSAVPRGASIPIVPARASIEPTSEARYRIQLNASSALKEKLELFKALVSHSVPSGDIDLAMQRKRIVQTDFEKFTFLPE